MSLVEWCLAWMLVVHTTEKLVLEEAEQLHAPCGLLLTNQRQLSGYDRGETLKGEIGYFRQAFL